MNITQEQNQPTMNNLLTFHNGFQIVADMTQGIDRLIYTAKNAYKACDAARLRIYQLDLPLSAQVVGHNLLIVRSNEL